MRRVLSNSIVVFLGFFLFSSAIANIKQTVIMPTELKNVYVQGDLRERAILAVSYLDKATPEDIWNGFTTGMWGADWPGRTLDAYSRTSLLLHKQSSSRFTEVAEGLLSRQNPDGAFYNAKAANEAEKGDGFWFGNARGMVGLLWAYKYTNDPKYLNAALRVGNYYMDHYFDVNQPAHGSFSWVATEAMVQLYKVSKDPNHLSLAKRIADSMLPVNQMSQHTHTYLLTLRGMAQIYEVTGEAKYLTMILQQYAYFKNNVMWPGGGIVEHFGNRNSYDINYWFDEGCSVDDWLGLNIDLWRVTLDTQYMDMAERVALNHLLYDQDAGGGFCGDRGGDFTREGSPWNFCCAMHGTRTLAELTQYIAMTDGKDVYINLFYPSSTELLVNGQTVKFVFDTNYPKDDNLKLTLNMSESAKFPLKIRVPAWSRVKSASFNDSNLPNTVVKDGYLTIEKEWKNGDVVKLVLDIPLRIEPRNKFIGDDEQTDYKKVSLWKGPRQLVYNQELNNHLWKLSEVRPALRYVYQAYEELKFDKSVKGTPLKIGEKSYSKGLGTHSVSEIEYALDGKFKEFKTDIGVDKCAGDEGSVRFKICVDGVVKEGSEVRVSATQEGEGSVSALYGFNVVSVTGKMEAKSVLVNVENAQTLRLVVDDAVNGLKNDYADWADARLVKADGTEVYLSDLPDDRKLGLPWDWGTVKLKEMDENKDDRIVTLTYEIDGRMVPVRFNYLADLGYTLIKHRPVLYNWMKVN
jgi:DUF1680 family protein